MSREKPEVFERGPFANTLDAFVDFAVAMMDNGTFYDVVVRDGTIEVDERGRDVIEFESSPEEKEVFIPISLQHQLADIETIDDFNGKPAATKIDFSTTIWGAVPKDVSGELLVVDVEDLVVTLRGVLTTAMSTAYIAGRLDASADDKGTNQRRFVRARQLGSVINFASDPLAELPFQDFDAGILGQIRASSVPSNNKSEV